jgi:acetamidase/formamidase
MPETLIKVDLQQSPYENEMIHNRWHPSIPMACRVKPGEDFVLETYDWTGGFIKDNDSADDVRDIDLSIVHFLSGPVGVHGAQPGDLDVHIAYRQACLNAIAYLTKFGYTPAQAYAILGTAPVQGHISGVVDIPNACATLWLPTQIFDFDINPSAAGPIKHIKGGVDLPLSQDK